MLPPLVHLLRELGINAEWVVLETDLPDFFALTKRIHNLIHGEGEPGFGASDRELFEDVNRRNADRIKAWVRPGDIVAVHDPQPMPLASMLREEIDVACLWRCHIGADQGDDIGLLFRPIVTQISRWDRLKGWRALMETFARLKTELREKEGLDPLDRRRLELTRLVLGGPDPDSVSDDPEGREVLEELTAVYRAYAPDIQADIALLALPMASVDENAHIVNALQRVSSVVIQNSLREGFGLTITEAMWKGVPVLSNRRAVGPRLQIRDGIDGRLIDDPRDETTLAATLEEMLSAPDRRDAWGRSAQARAQERFLIFTQIDAWLELIQQTLRSRRM